MAGTSARNCGLVIGEGAVDDGTGDATLFLDAMAPGENDNTAFCYDTSLTAGTGMIVDVTGLKLRNKNYPGYENMRHQGHTRWCFPHTDTTVTNGDWAVIDVHNQSFADTGDGLLTTMGTRDVHLYEYSVRQYMTPTVTGCAVNLMTCDSGGDTPNASTCNSRASVSVGTNGAFDAMDNPGEFTVTFPDWRLDQDHATPASRERFGFEFTDDTATCGGAQPGVIICITAFPYDGT
jgi:hypothetical protein